MADDRGERQSGPEKGPAVSVVVPCYNEEKSIRLCLESLAGQDYRRPFEIIVVDNNSSDETLAVAGEFSRQHPGTRLLSEPKKGTAAARNSGVKNAQWSYIAFIDADCQAPPGWLSLLVKSYREAKFRDEAVIAAGGRNIAPEHAAPFVRAVEIALDSYLGSFASIQGRQVALPAFVPSLSLTNALYEKSKILEVGGFDESLGSEAEDADINSRLVRRGCKFLFVPQSFVWHQMRSSPKSWLKNMFRYGKGRARLLKRYPKMWRINFILPLLFLPAMACIFLAVFSRIFLIPALYFPLIFCVSLYQSLRKKALPLLWRVISVYMIQHFGYAAGEIFGLLHPRVK
jgi:cellulose synthase/poly-beta-1,6-N-acetylglucosamine synthase-like glycosyltransferase